MTETQDKKPDVEENLERVGITNLRTIVQTRWRGHSYRFVPRIELAIDLEKNQKGAHMSRLVESIAEIIEREIEEPHRSLEELEKHVLERLLEKHRYKRAEMQMETELVVQDRTPVTGRQTMETHDVNVKVFNDNGRFRKILGVEVTCNTVCPHALERTKKPHIQRAKGMLEIITSYGNNVKLETMIDCVERAFSSKVYTLLKTEDERHVVDRMFERPKFVEDVTRGIISNAKKKFRDCEIRAKTVSYESIHRHDVIAEGSCTV